MKIDPPPSSPMAHLRAMLFNPLTLAWVAGLAAMVVLSLIPRAGLSEIESGFGRDKLARALTFAILSFYPAACFPSFRMGLIVSTCMAPLGFMLELVQKYVPGRHFSPEDMIANNIGAIMGIALALALRFFFHTAQYSKKIHFSRLADAPSAKSMVAHRKKPPIRNEARQPAHSKTTRWPTVIAKISLRKNRKKLLAFMFLAVLGYIGWTLAFDYFRPMHVAKQSRPITVPEMSQVAAPPADTVAQTAASTTDATAKSMTSTAPSVEPGRHETARNDAVPANSMPPTADTPPLPTAEKTTGHPSQPAQADQLNRETHGPFESETAKPLFSVRVGAFLSRQNAENLIAHLKSSGYQPYLFTATDADKQTWYTVQVSDHETLDQAATAAAIFKKKENRSVYITHKDSLTVSESAATAAKESETAK